MKKYIALCLVFLLCLSFAAGCATGNGGEGKTLSVVCTTYPEYDWARELLGERKDTVNLTLLLDSSTDLHNYQPTAKDILTVANCDLFIYIGGESDDWVPGVLQQSGKEGRLTLNLTEALGNAVLEEETPDGAEEEDHDHDHDHDHEEEEHVSDEHIWLSLRNAKTLCAAIAEKLAAIDPAGAEVYRENCAAYTEKLTALDEAYTTAIAAAPKKELVFGDRFPFRYLAHDYGLTCAAAFAGCSAESEASFETVLRLAQRVDEWGLSAVMAIEGSNHDLAKTVISSTTEKNQKLLVLNSLQSANGKDGMTYLRAMENNLSVLREALQ